MVRTTFLLMYLSDSVSSRRAPKCDDGPPTASVHEPPRDEQTGGQADTGEVYSRAGRRGRDASLSCNTWTNPASLIKSTNCLVAGHMSMKDNVSAPYILKAIGSIHFREDDVWFLRYKEQCEANAATEDRIKVLEENVAKLRGD